MHIEEPMDEQTGLSAPGIKPAMCLQGTLITHAPKSTASLLESSSDPAAIEIWLKTVARSEHTMNSYAKEAYRFMLFLALRQKTLAQVKLEDLLEYEKLLSNPQPAAQWIADANYPRDDARWRPFVAHKGKRVGLSPTSIRQSMTVLATMFRWLNGAGHIDKNPFQLIRRKKERDETSVTRYLPPEMQEVLLKWIERMPQNTQREVAHYHRVRWIFHLLLLSGLRASEVSGSRMGDFKFDPRMQEAGWWLSVMGKGKKKRDIPVPERLVESMKTYRTHLGLSALPEFNESTPLVGSVFDKRKKSGQPIGRYAVFRIIKEVVKRAAKDLESHWGAAMSMKLQAVSTHWLRHSYGSSLADHGADIRTIQGNMGHESYETSNQYLHKDAEIRHRETRKL